MNENMHSNASQGICISVCFNFFNFEPSLYKCTKYNMNFNLWKLDTRHNIHSVTPSNPSFYVNKRHPLSFTNFFQKYKWQKTLRGVLYSCQMPDYPFDIFKLFLISKRYNADTHNYYLLNICMVLIHFWKL
jgi:hypothetical protein